MKKSIVVVCAVLLIQSIATAKFIWETEVISSEPGMWEASLALDQGDNPHVSYRLYYVPAGVQYDKMVYSYKDGQDWVSSIFDFDGAYESLAIDSQGFAHISYYSEPGEDLAYTYWDGTDWQKKIVDKYDHYGSVGGFTSLVLDENDNPHISYMDWTGSYRIKYAHDDGTGWQIQEFPGWSGRTDMTLDNSGNPHIAAGGQYGYWDGSSWQISTFESGGGVGEISIELDSAGNPHIAYSDGSIKYAYWNGFSWEVQKIGYGFGKVSLELDSSDIPHIMSKYCYYMTLVNGNWVTESLASGHFEDFALDSHDRIHFVYTPDFESLVYMHQIEVAVAVAGPNQTVYAYPDGFADVTLDGSDSNDPDGDDLTYRWSWSIGGIAYDTNTVNPTIELPVGEHIITLIVNDGSVDSEPDYVTITVVEAIEAKLRIMPRTLNRTSRGRYIIVLMQLSEGITKSQVSNEKVVLYPDDEGDDIEASRQFVLRRIVNGAEQVIILALFDRAALLAAVPDNGRTELEVSGMLNTGQIFYGEASINIIDPKNILRPTKRTVRRRR